MLSFVTTASAQRGAVALDLEGFASAADEDALNLANESITVEAWIKHDGNSEADAIIVSKRNNTTIDYQLSLAGSGEEVPVRFYIYSTTYFAESSVGVPANQWTHVAGTYDGSTISIYVNGELRGTHTTSGASLLASGPLAVGSNSGGSGQFFSGQIDEVRIWDVVRSAEAIRSTMYEELAGNESGLRAYYSFSGDGSDAVGENDLSFTGSAAVVAPGIFPVPPGIFAASGNASVALHWNERLGNSNANQASMFRLYRSTQADGSDRQEIATLPSGTTSYTDTGVTNDVTYFYEVSSVDAAGSESDFSYAVAAAPYATRGGGSLSMGGSGYAFASERPSLMLGNESLTVEAWIKHDGTSDADAIILTRRDNTQIDYQISLVGSGEEVPARFYIYSPSYYAESGVGIPANQWTHIAGTYNGSIISIYVNGELQGTRTTSGATLSPDSPLTFGSNTNGSGQFYSGLIDEVRIWDVARPLFDLRRDYQLRLAGHEQGLRAYFQFDSPGSTTPQGNSALGPGTLELVGDAANVKPGVIPIPPHLYVEPTGNAVSVSWSGRNAEDPSQLKLYRSTQPDGSDRQELATLPGSATSYTDTNLNLGVTYFYELTAVNASGQESDYASMASATAAGTRDGNALQVGGTGGFAQVSHRPSLELANESLTVEAWIKHDGTGDADAVILTKREGTTIDYQLSLVGAGDDLPVRFYIYSPNYYAESSVAIPAGEWTHVAGTYNGSTISIFVNGELSGTRTTSGASLANTAPLTIGANTNGSGNFFSGLIDEVRIWDVVLPLFTIRQSYLNLLTGNEEGLRAYYRFDETGGTIARGSTPHAMTATLHGTATFTAAQSPVANEDDVVLPGSFVLDANYPNPFNPSTTIRFGLNEPGAVRVVVFDVTGRQVAVVLDGEMRQAGWHEIAFDASGLTSGVYMYRVEAGRHSGVGRMSLVK